MNKNLKRNKTGKSMLVHSVSTTISRECDTVDEKTTKYLKDGFTQENSNLENFSDVNKGILCSKSGKQLPINIVCHRRSIADDKPEQTHVKTLRGKERAKVHQFFKELRLSNTLETTWNIDKKPTVNNDLEDLHEEDNSSFVNLKECKPSRSAIQSKSENSQRSFKERDDRMPNQHSKHEVFANFGKQISLRYQQMLDTIQVSNPLLARKIPREISRKNLSNMASTSEKQVSASAVASVSAATVASLVIPMTSDDDYNKNLDVFEEAGLSPAIATVSGKYMSINIHVNKKNEIEDFIKQQGLTVLNKYTLTSFRPYCECLEYTVSRKRKAPQPPKPATSTPVVEKNIKVSQKKKTQKPTTVVVEKKSENKEQSQKRKATVKAVEEGLDLSPSTSAPKLKKFTEVPRVEIKNKKALDKWFELKPEQVKELRTTVVNHKKEVLASTVKADCSFASQLKGMMIGEPKVVYIKPKEQPIPMRLRGIPYRVWKEHHKDIQYLEKFYKRIFRTVFFTFRSRWSEHTAICKKTKRPIDMNPYLVDMEYMWQLIVKSSPQLKDRWTAIEEWKAKVVAFYPRNAFNAGWHKLKPATNND